MSARALCLFALPSFCFSHFFPSFARRWPRWKKLLLAESVYHQCKSSTYILYFLYLCIFL